MHQHLSAPAREHENTLRAKSSTVSELGAANIIGQVLQSGVLLSALIIMFGIVLLMLQPGGISGRMLLEFPRTPGQVWTGLLHGQAQAVVTLGLLLLIATPIMRVAASVLLFALERDRHFVVITSLVLAILLFSLFLTGEGSTGGKTVVQFHFSLEVAGLIFLGALLAGLLGSLVGLGGGILLVPMLTLLFHLPISFAVGASIISVIATSSAAAAAFVRDRLSNIRIGMFLEVATTIGAISGAFLVSANIIGVVFGIVLVISALPLVFKIGEELPRGVKNDRWANALRLAGSYPDHQLKREVPYQVTHTLPGFIMMYIAGLISGLLGIGSGSFKVVAMDALMKLPLKVSTTTSNLMIGVTAAASAGIYFSRGDIPPFVAAPVALGVLLGAFIGARLLLHISNRLLRILFMPVIFVAALEMILHGLGMGAF